MLPKGYLYYTFSPLLYCFLAFLTGYILGRMRIGFTASIYKLLILLSMLFLLQIIIYKIRKKYSKKKKRLIRPRAPEEYYERI